MNIPALTLEYRAVANWPALAWLAVCEAESSRVLVLHGAGIETRPLWFCEAVWDDAFEEGGFDLTDIVAGSGARIRESGLTFVSSGSTCDRLQYTELEDANLVSNSLACLVAAVEAEFAPEYTGYHADINSIVDGLNHHCHVLASSSGSIELVYYRNIRFDGRSLKVIDKPNPRRDFGDFARYQRFLDECMRSVAENLSNNQRAYRYGMVTALSSGYDSTTVACLAARHGCREAFSFDRARGDLDDTGGTTADRLGLSLRVLGRNDWALMNCSELPFVAADGHGEDRYYATAAELLANKVLFTGYHGDKVWDKDVDPEYLVPDLKRGDASGLSLTEFRLFAGFIHCPVPFWGARQIREINAIARQPSMEPWDVGGTYNRPICRRIVEESGVPRGSFGVRKKAASVLPHTEELFATPSCLHDYLKWLRRQRWRLIAKGKPLFLISPRWDSWRYQLVALSERSIRLLAKAMSRLPLVWRHTDHPIIVRGQHLVIKMRPFYIRKYLFPWAIGAAAARYDPVPLDEKSVEE